MQGSAAGGHRGTHRVEDEPLDLEWPAALGDVRNVTALPVLADEAGTSAAHRAGLSDPRIEWTVITRAFSGRPARSLRNDFVDRFDLDAPPVYPAVNRLTSTIRAAAALREDPHGVALWAGTGWRCAQGGSAAQIVAELTG